MGRGGGGVGGGVRGGLDEALGRFNVNRATCPFFSNKTSSEDIAYDGSPTAYLKSSSRPALKKVDHFIWRLKRGHMISQRPRIAFGVVLFVCWVLVPWV